MLHTIDEQGNITWYCRDPLCPYHSCQNWDDGIQCLAHPNRPTSDHIAFVEEIHTAHISDEGVQWTGPHVISLPVCSECGEKTGLRVHDDSELIPPIITRDANTNEILQVAPHPHPKYAPNLWQTHVEMTRKRVPHETLSHLTPDQIEELQAYNRSKAPQIPVDWMLTEAIHVDIKGVTQHPAVARHRSLAQQMEAAGKVYTPLVETAPTTEEQVSVYLAKQVRMQLGQTDREDNP